jgi:hypothetical protein
MLNTVLLNAFYDAGNKIGVAMSWITTLTIVFALAYVMVKYVFAKSKD